MYRNVESLAGALETNIALSVSHSSKTNIRMKEFSSQGKKSFLFCICVRYQMFIELIVLIIS